MSARCSMLAHLYQTDDYASCHGLYTRHYHGIRAHGYVVLGSGVRRCEHKHQTPEAAKACTKKG